jgi:hypothetical protein
MNAAEKIFASYWHAPDASIPFTDPSRVEEKATDEEGHWAFYCGNIPLSPELFKT